MIDTGNLLIDQLPRQERQRLKVLLEPFALHPGEHLCERGEPSSHVFFPASGCVVLVMQTDGHAGLGVGLLGREGMLGAHLALNTTVAPWTAVVHATGTAWRLRSTSFRRECARSSALRQVIDRYACLMFSQLVIHAGCLSRHLIGPRLARWLLLSQDRADTDHQHVTHQVLADLLGVRRVGITMAAGALQRRGLIGYHRGEVTVLDRPGLELAACSCFAQDHSSQPPAADTEGPAR